MPDRRGRGAAWVLLGTAVGGGAGYVVAAFSGPLLGVAAYAVFAVFWSALYLLVSATSGIQQEVTRASHPIEESGSDATGLVARRFAVIAAGVVAAIVLVTGPFWMPGVLGERWFALMWPLAFGVASYAVVTVYAGVLYGLQRWRPIAILVIIDGLLRLALVGGALLATDDLVVIAWAVVIPFLAAPVLQWPFVRRQVVGRFGLDVGIGRLAVNAMKTVVGAAATGVVISGFPLLLGAVAGPQSTSTLAAIVFALNLIRAPIVVVVLALQSYLVVRFKTRPIVATREAGMLSAVIVTGSALIAGAAFWWGQAAFETLFGKDFALPGAVLAGIVGSAAALGVMCVTGPLAIARGMHSLYTAGWVAAALTTIVLLAVAPLGLESRAILALWAGPIVGLIVHVTGIVATRRAAGFDLRRTLGE